MEGKDFRDITLPHEASDQIAASLVRLIQLSGNAKQSRTSGIVNLSAEWCRNELPTCHPADKAYTPYPINPRPTRSNTTPK